jgi:diacylglycerol kinase family enzyme
VEDAFAAAGVTAAVRVAAPPDLERVLVEAVSRRPDAIVVGGGDGTVAGAAARLLDTGVALGVLPLGTFNLAARQLGIPLDLRAAVEALVGARKAQIDVLEVAGRPCLCATVLGLYPALAMREGETYHGRAWWKKSVQIAVQTWRAFDRWPPLTLTVETDEGTKVVRKTRFAALVPGELEDALAVMPKRKSLVGGKLSVYVSRHQSFAAFARGLTAYLLGRLNSDREVERVETGALVLDARRRRSIPVMIDGEPVRLSLPIEVRVRPGALAVLIPVGRDD